MSEYQRELEEQFEQFKRQRLAEECAKLDPEAEKALAEEGMAVELEIWPEY
ncbi:MAG: hypothetical protein KIT87_24820 [Anaerolineae bacterium]|nr:hypothetical protein [Anaerolineae bacterium]